MADTLPFSGPIKERAKEGLDRLLLAPVFLIHEIVAVLLPGLLFVVLLFAKGNAGVISAFQTALLGYKTKLFIALVFSYLAGKVFLFPSEVAAKFVMNRFSKSMKDSASQHMKDVTNKFLLGVFILPEFFGTEHALTYFVLSYSTAAFYFSNGVVLLVSSLVPGDNYFRLIESLVGFFLCFRGYNSFDACLQIGIAMFGVSFSGTIQKMFPGKMATVLQIGLALMSAKTGPKVEPASSAQTAASPATPTANPQEPAKKTA